MILKSTAYNNCFLMTEDAAFEIVYGGDRSMVFTADDAAELMKVLTGFEVAKAAAASQVKSVFLKVNNVIRYVCQESVLGGAFQVVELHVDGKHLPAWNLSIYTEKGEMKLPDGILVNIWEHLVDCGLEKAWSFGKFSDIEFVVELPEISEDGLVPSEATVFVLTKAFEDKAASSAWRFNGDKYVEFSDVPPVADPEDASTIPDTEVKEEVTGSVGGTDVEEVQVWNNQVTESKLEVTAKESASIVNSVVNDGAVNVSVG